MPMTMWEDIVGETCVECNKPASHFWGVTPVCCQCHGGGMFTAEETEFIHKYYKEHGSVPDESLWPRPKGW